MLRSPYLMARASLLLALVVTVLGWKLLWFLTDDAFITFRYAANWISGIGPTWNPAPFAHVEGYSNFSWLVVLSAIWYWLGIEPPQIANWISLFLGIGSVLLTARWLMRLTLESSPTFADAAVFALALLLVCTNKSFLTWLSSGLETSLFTLLTLGWAYVLCRDGGRRESIGWGSALLLAALAALTRPDGLLFWGATICFSSTIILFSPRTRLSVSERRLAVLGFLIVPVHLLWRRYYYHDWLPNTYYAKVHHPWTEMGLRYLLSYIIEYALYIPFVIAAVTVAARWRSLPKMMTVGVYLIVVCIAAQIAYYTLIVGGDHFEYRIFHHLAPLTVIAIFGLLKGVRRHSASVIGASLLWLLAQSAIPWTHWYYSKDLNTRKQTLGMTVPIAEKFPAPAKALVSLWDRLQAEMISHSVGMRHQEHKIFYLFQRAGFMPRAEGAKMPWSERNVLALGSVGVPGWVYPNAAIIDQAGLNNRTLAKQSFALQPAVRQMAHDIAASRQYLDCYRTNIRATPEQLNQYLTVLIHRPVAEDVAEGEFGMRILPQPRSSPLTDAEIVACEQYPWTPDELYSKHFYWY